MMHRMFVILLGVCLTLLTRNTVTSFVPRPSARRYPFRTTRLYVASSEAAARRDEVSGDSEPPLAGDDVVETKVPPSVEADQQQQVMANNGSTEPPQEKDRMLSDDKTLYEVLNASPDATRDELKKQYKTLARATHPDAMLGATPEERKEAQVVFTEVAAAWRILSDKRERQRYDRSLKAKAFTEEVEKVASQYAEKSAIAVSRALEQIAMPFFRKTAGTTMASFNAAAQEVKDNGRNLDFGSAIGSAMKAGQKVGRVIDRYELLKKSRELEQKSMREIERSMVIKGELSNVMNKRLSLSLRTPNSALTSAEALKILDGFNTEDSVTLLESIRRKHPIIHEINCLEEVEQEYDETMQNQALSQKEQEEMREALWKADVKAKQAVEAEQAAREALEEAQRQVIATRQQLFEFNRQYTVAEQQQRRATNDADRVSLSLARKQERVRTALRRKEEELLDLNVHHEDSSLDMLGLSDLERLRKEEGYLRAESNRLDDRAKRFRSRAKKLFRRSEELKDAEMRATTTNEDNVAIEETNSVEQSTDQQQWSD